MKKSTILIKAFSLALVLLMLVSMLPACNKQGEGGKTEEKSQNANAVDTDENGIPLDALPDNLNFNREFSILGNDNRKHQYWCEDADAVSNIDKVIYARNMTVCERMGVEFQWEFLPGEGKNIGDFIDRIRSTSQTGAPYDGIIAYNLVPQMVANQGLSANLYDTDHIDLTAPWWPSVYLREMVVNEQLYCLVESGSYGLLNHMMAMYFNNDLLEARNLESPYELVKSNEWTVATLKEMIKDTYEDAEADGKVGEGDIFGYSTGTKSKMDCWFFALGNQFSKVENGEVVSLMNGEHIGRFVDTMVDLLSTNDSYPFSSSSQFGMFMENRVYFFCSSVMLSEKLAAATDITYNYGVVPMPKMDSTQERYYTHVANCHDTWCVPYNVSDMKCTSAVMECMASEAFRQINPTYYDIYVKLRYAPDDRLAEMYDLIRDSVTFDFTYLFSRVFTNMPGDLVKNCYLSPEKYVWATVYAQNENALNASFEEIVKTFADKQ